MKKRIIFIAAMALLLAGCSTVILVRALWQKTPVVVDGNEQDWVDRTFYLNEQDVSIGVQNDKDNFYLFVKLLNPGQMRAVRFAGLTIWLDPAGGSDKEYGIRIPGKPMRPGEMSGSDIVMMPNDINEVEIFSKGKKDPLQVPVAQLKGIQFATSRTAENLIFEFKFPLKETTDNPFGWNAVSDELGVTLETGKMERPHKEGVKPEFGEPQEEGNRPPMGMDEGGERAGGGRRGGHLGEIKQRDKSAELDFWFKVRLAKMKK
jgi:hypothetical protein